MEDIYAAFALLIAVISFFSGVIAGTVMKRTWVRVLQVYLLQLVINSALAGVMFKFPLKSFFIHPFFSFFFALAITAAFVFGLYFSRR